MKHLIPAILAALILTGCLQSETTIRLNRDGSGTVVEQTTLGAQMLGMLEQMAGLGGDKGKDPLADMFSPEKAKVKAGGMGEGVTFEESVPFEAGGNKGARTTYRFADINKLRISPGDGMKNISPMGAMAPETPKQKPVAFKYVDGTLTITMPEAEKPVAAPDAPAAPDLSEMGEQEKAMMKQMLGDLKMSFKLVVEPGIAETDATYRDDKTVTLVEMEMGRLLEKPEVLNKLAAADKNNPAASLELLKGLEGVKMETKKQVTVKVK